MLFDGFKNVNNTVLDLPVPVSFIGGASFPLEPRIGLLFQHDTHGLCVYTHNLSWFTISQEPTTEEEA